MKKTFTKPSEEEIANYLTDVKHYQEEAAKTFAEKFWSYYQSCGWKVGKALKPMVDWKAAIRTWEVNNKKSANEANRTGNNYQSDNRQGTSVARIEALRNW